MNISDILARLCGASGVSGDETEASAVAAELHGLRLLFIPVGEVARDYGKRHRVVLEGFCTPDGRRFPRRGRVYRIPGRKRRAVALAARACIL